MKNVIRGEAGECEATFPVELEPFGSPGSPERFMNSGPIPHDWSLYTSISNFSFQHSFRSFISPLFGVYLPRLPSLRLPRPCVTMASLVLHSNGNFSRLCILYLRPVSTRHPVGGVLVPLDKALSLVRSPDFGRVWTRDVIVDLHLPIRVDTGPQLYLNQSFHLQDNLVHAISVEFHGNLGLRSKCQLNWTGVLGRFAIVLPGSVHDHGRFERS